MRIAPEHIQQFRSDGYFVLERALSEQQLDLLRSECQRHIKDYEAEMEAQGVKDIGISHYKKRYFIANRGYDHPEVADFLTGELMAEICQATLGEDVFLFDEKYVVKVPQVGTKFGWHQDSGYIGHYHEPYLSCWCALDDMTLENGTLYVLPYERALMHPEDLFEHTVEEETNDRVGYYGEDPGIPLLVPAGSIVVFSSRLFHRSGANVTPHIRRAYEAHYSAKPIMDERGSKPLNKAIPILQKGQRVVLAKV